MNLSELDWQVTILPLPKGFSRGVALGFCGGHAVGRAEIPRGNRVIGCWWPDGKADSLTLKGREVVRVGHARGDVIPGHWSDKKGSMHAVAWTLRAGRLVGAELDDAAYERTWAVSAGGGAVVGVGSPAATSGQRRPNVGLLWRDGAVTPIAADREVSMFATDGTRLAGSVMGRATLWAAAAATPVDLTPTGLAMSEVQALDGDLQIGIAWKGFCPRAAIWRGSAASFADITPQQFEAASAYDGAGGYQVGFVRTKDNTAGGTPGSDNRAVIWHGSSDEWFDLNALLPAKKYNASIAWAIEFRDDAVHVCGAASRYEVSNPGTAYESHPVPVQHPVVWTAKMSAR